MKTGTRQSTLIWIIIILLATNLATIGSFLYRRYSETQQVENEDAAVSVQVPTEQRTRFFREQLDLSSSQVDEFRFINRHFNRSANPITAELETLRSRMVDELGKEKHDTTALNRITERIGELHTDLKEETIEFYINMKNVCDEEQKVKLYELFKAMLDPEGQVGLPEHSRQYRNQNIE